MNSLDAAKTSYKYKQIEHADVTLLKNLLSVFAQSFDDPETYKSKIPSDTYLQSLLSKPYFIALVAMYDGDVIGGVTAYELEKPEKERREIYIYDLAISESHRRHGIATALINKLKQIAKERGAYVIFVQADQGDAPAIKLYESLGRKANVLHFDIPVD